MLTLHFADSMPAFNQQPVLISGDEMSTIGMRSAYLIAEENEIVQTVFEIKYEYHCSPFKEAMVKGNVLAVGFEGNFYLFSLNKNKNILSLEMSGYFGHLYVDSNLFYVADADGLYCINESGNVLWHNSKLGIDGVIISDFTDTTVSGQGEWDPPGGWRVFVLDKETGIIVEGDI